ncbi:MAG TPA: methionine biosynthesis protein MetW [Candidatus Methanoperedenaceae archaeon]|nr:methionine biosynthesis protein MetW [Candidatus Methanoperedenaceae archaeon]
MTEPNDSIRMDYRVIADLVSRDSSVLDLGCNEGELLTILIREKNVRAHGIEIDENAIYACVAKGLSVSHQDIDNGLSEYGDKSFDYVILNQSLQQVLAPDKVMTEALRVGKDVIIGFPNFAYFKVRCQIFFTGRTPVTSALPYKWYDTPNLHFMSISDFTEYCKTRGFRIKQAVFLNDTRTITVFPNLFAQTGIFMLSS